MRLAIVAALLIAGLLVAACTAAAPPAAPSPTLDPATPAVEKLPKLILAVPPGQMAIPASYLIANDMLSAVAERVELVIWENPDQLRAIVAGNQAHLVMLPSNNAAVFYNRGLPVRLLEISVWNASYVIGTKAGVDSLADLRGERVAIPFQGSVPDLMFQYMCRRAGLDPTRDFDLRYAANPQQAAQMLLAGEVDHAVLPEPQATAALLSRKPGDPELFRAVAYDAAWREATGGDTATPISGTIALATLDGRPEVVDEFLRQYALAVEWLVAHPAEAGSLAEAELPQLGFKANLTAESLAHTTWGSVPAWEARTDVERFFSILAELSPEVIGGKVPDEGFYYRPGVSGG